MRHVLNLHNFYRRQAAQQYQVANMNKLTWSDRLAERAREHIRCSSWRKRQRTRLARANINVGKFRSQVSLATDLLIASWYSQRNFALHNGSAFDGCSPWYKCLEFRAMLNANHHSMGCAVLPSCGRRRHYSVLLCVYEGGSNNEATFDFLHGSTCSKCGTSLALDGLCDMCTESDPSQCECRKTCFKDGVGQGQLNSTSCTCNCQYGLGPNCDEPCRNPENLIGLNVCRTSYNRNSDPELGALTPLDCQLFGQFCPEQCLCSPWPTTEQADEPDTHATDTDLEYVDPEDDDFLFNSTELIYVDPHDENVREHHEDTVHSENDVNGHDYDAHDVLLVYV